MNFTAAFLESWIRQAQIVDSVADLVTEENRSVKPSADGWSLDMHLAHMHGVRKFFMPQISEEWAAKLSSSYDDETQKPIADLQKIKQNLRESGEAVADIIRSAIETDQTEGGWYDHPVLYFQHCLWHDGWHVSLIMLALRLNGQEPTEEWEEDRIWGLWRTEVWD